MAMQQAKSTVRVIQERTLNTFIQTISDTNKIGSEKIETAFFLFLIGLWLSYGVPLLLTKQRLMKTP